MRAVGMRAIGEPAVLELPGPPEPQAGEVRVAVHLSAISIAEVRAVRGDRLRHFGQVIDPARPFILGFAATGFVEASRSADVPAGRAVVLSGLDTCGVCRYCRQELENHCLRRRMSGIDVDSPGFMREEVTLPARRVFPLPEGFRPDLACVVSEVATAVHALRQADFQPGESLAVVGAGRHGRQIIRVAKRWKAGRIVAIDPSAEALTRARAAGADVAREPGPTEPVDVAVHANSDETTLLLCCDLVRPRGRVVLLGTPTGIDVPIPDFVERVIVPERRLVATDSKASADFRESIALMAEGSEDWELRRPRRVPLADAPATLRRCAASWPPEEEYFVEVGTSRSAR